MKRTISVIIAGSLLLAGCAYPATQMQLNSANAACAAGDPNACYAAQMLAQQATFEAQQNANATATGLAALAIIGGAVALGVNSGPHYHHHWHRY